MASCFSLCLVATATSHANWPQFRGPNSSGIAAGPSPPIQFGPGKNELWSVSLEAGHSSPCVVGDAIFLTTYNKQKKSLAVICIDRASGSTRWQRDVAVEQMEKGHPSFNPASSSPACDGERVVAYFGSYGLICFDITGEKLWDVKMPLTKSFGGNATSPIIAGDSVILYRGNYVDHFVLAVDKRTGKERWKIPQTEKFTGEMGCTSCPIVSGDNVIIHSARSVQAFEISTGRQIWMTKCATTATSTPVLAGKEVVIAAWNKMGEPALKPPFPKFDQLVAEHDDDDDQLISRREFPKLWIFHRPEGVEAPMNGGTIRFQQSDHNKDGKVSADEWQKTIKGVETFRSQYETHGIIAVRTDSQGLVESSQMRTLETQSVPEVPSPLVCDGYLYVVKNGGVLTCLEVKTGIRTARMRTGGKGTHYASPVAAGGRLFCTAGNGTITVLSPGPKPTIIAVNEMQEETYATPAIVDGVLYLRTHSKLFAFGNQ